MVVRGQAAEPGHGVTGRELSSDVEWICQLWGILLAMLGYSSLVVGEDVRKGAQIEKVERACGGCCLPGKLGRLGVVLSRPLRQCWRMVCAPARKVEVSRPEKPSM
jgi:hypothetical protein